MSLDVGQTIEDGFRRTFSRNGLVLALVYTVFNTLNQVASQSLFKNILPGVVPNMADTTVYPLALETGTMTSGVLWFVTAIIGAILGLGTLRLLVNWRGDSIPREYFIENLLTPAANIMIGGIIFAIIIMTGFMLLIIPGIFLLVSLLFWMIYVATENQNFIQAFKSSWGLAKGNRFKLFGIGVLLTAVNLLAFHIVNIPASFLLGRAISTLITQIPLSIMTIVNLAAIASAYNQLRE